MDLRQAGKLCVVTGAGRGVGAAIARRLAREGGRVVVTDKDADAARAVADEIGGEPFALDVADEARWSALAAAHPKIDVLANNAGVTGFEAGRGPHDPENASLGDWRAVQQVNLDGAFLGCRYAIRGMRANGRGAIVNVASRSAMIGAPAAAAYAASKAALLSLTKSVALYCAQQSLDVRCNAVLPGAVLTPMWDAALGDGPDRAARMTASVAGTPMKRFGSSDEIAAACAFLASDDAGYMTGAELAVDGGLCAGPMA